jgi:hypothetical protein
VPARFDVASVKIRLRDGHIRVVPGRGLDGCPFGGPGVDLFDDDAARVIAAAAPLLAGLATLEPGVLVRSISVDFGRSRVLATLEAEPKARVVHVTGPLPERWLEAASELVPVLEAAVEKALLRRKDR